ncbi:MAG: helix-turn-helix domain-containing protein [Alphaproteobacteria bacterium]|nr:helix-turn-helix domain-containing protein [Alphaproteobacteria bacterium]
MMPGVSPEFSTAGGAGRSPRALSAACARSTIEKFSTSGLCVDERLEFWNRLTDETYPGTTVDPSTETFEAEMLRWTLGDLTMIRPRSNASLVSRDRPGGEPERIVLHLQHRGRGEHRQYGRMAELSAGDFALCKTAAPYQIEISDHEFLVVDMPRAALERRIEGLDDVISRSISGSSPGSRLLHNFFLTLWQQGDLSAVEPGWQQGVADVLLDLIGLAVKGAAMPLSEPRALRERALAVIDARLCDPDLGSAGLACELGVSIRTVQNLFAAMGTTPGGYILSRRLARASELLTVNPQASITEIAFDLGFSESGYFARCFRQQFGTTPSKWRIGA